MVPTQKRTSPMRTFRILALALVASLAASGVVFSQSGGSVNAIAPLTRDIGSIRTLTAATAATYNSADQNGFNVSRITCVLNHASKVGTPASVLTIQGKDAVSGLYYTLIASSSITNTATANPVSVGAGIANSANVSASLPIPATWRVSVGVTGTTSVTGTVGCSIQ